MRRLPDLARFALLALLFSAAPVRADDTSAIRELLARGDAQAALKLAERTVAARPRDVPARFLQGVALMDLQRDEDALAHFTRMSQDYPDLPDPLNNMALLHARAGRPELARLALEDALRADPSHRLARSNLGHVHLMLAVQAWDRAAALGPLDPAVQRRLEAARALLGGRTAPSGSAAR